MTSQSPISFTVKEINPNVKNGVFRTKPVTAAPWETIAHLRKVSATSFDKSSNSIQLVYFGKILEDSLTFEAAGIREGSTVLVYPKPVAELNVPRDKRSIKMNIVKGILKLYKMKGLHVLGRTEFLEKIYLDMPELDTSILALLQASRLFLRCILPDYLDELDVFAEKYPLLGEVLSKATEWAPSILRVIPPEHPNMFTLDLHGDDSDLDPAEDVAGVQSVSNNLASSSSAAVPTSSNHSEELSSEGTQSQPQPGPSREPQPGTSRTTGRNVTAPMLQAALQAAYSRQAGVASQTFAWQLEVMSALGFTDEKACIEALVRSGGDVDLAVNFLFRD